MFSCSILDLNVERSLGGCETEECYVFYMCAKGSLLKWWYTFETLQKLPHRDR